MSFLYTHICLLPSKSAVDCSTLDGGNRKTVIKERLEKPRGIAVHPQAK